MLMHRKVFRLTSSRAVCVYCAVVCLGFICRKGLLVMRGNNDCSYSTLCAISSLIVMFSGAARWITVFPLYNALCVESIQEECNQWRRKRVDGYSG